MLCVSGFPRLARRRRRGLPLPVGFVADARSSIRDRRSFNAINGLVVSIGNRQM
jgi:hypothetical protein